MEQLKYRATITHQCRLRAGDAPRGAESLSTLAKPSGYKGLVIFYPRLSTESVVMSVLNFPNIPLRTSVTNLIREHDRFDGSVIAAAQRFTERHCPVNSFVQHPEYGFGTVVACDGHRRDVDFEMQRTKAVDELAADEWPESVDPQALVSVSWIEITPRLVPVSSLKLLKLQAEDKYKRWRG